MRVHQHHPPLREPRRPGEPGRVEPQEADHSQRDGHVEKEVHEEELRRDRRVADEGAVRAARGRAGRSRSIWRPQLRASGRTRPRPGRSRSPPETNIIPASRTPVIQASALGPHVLPWTSRRSDVKQDGDDGGVGDISVQGPDPPPEIGVALDAAYRLVRARDLVDEEQVDAGDQGYREAEGGERAGPVERVVLDEYDPIEDPIERRDEVCEPAGAERPPVVVPRSRGSTGIARRSGRAARALRGSRPAEDC